MIVYLLVYILIISGWWSLPSVRKSNLSLSLKNNNSIGSQVLWGRNSLNLILSLLIPISYQVGLICPSSHITVIKLLDASSAAMMLSILKKHILQCWLLSNNIEDWKWVKNYLTNFTTESKKPELPKLYYKPNASTQLQLTFIKISDFSKHVECSIIIWVETMHSD